MTWLSGYNYRKSITLSRASGAVSNYQMKLLLGESSGATGEDVDCGGCCLSSFDDLRFTKSDGSTLLDYWIESISGTTPNQLATVWIEFDSIGTSATTFYMYYGNAAAASVSSGANTFIVFDDFERGNNGDTVGGSWTELAAHVHISTEQKYGGTRAAKFIGDSDGNSASIPVTAGENIAIRMMSYVESGGNFMPFIHGNGTNGISVQFDESGNINYYTTEFVDTGVNYTADAWKSVEVRNFNYTALTYDIYYNDTIIKSGAAMRSLSANNNENKTQGHTAVSAKNCWIDNFIVRNFRATEPTWGSWGAMEEWAEGITTETATATDTFDGGSLSYATSESAEATATFDGDSLRDSTSESAEAADTFGNERTAYGLTTESAEATDTMDALHLVDATTESASASDSMEAEDLIRKKIKFPNLQGKHLSLKFESATDGSFAIYYLRHKMFKTRELTSDQKHPNTQGSHLGLKLHNTGTDDFILMYVSEKMQLVTT